MMFWVYLLAAIGEVESGNNPKEVGKGGEISQYQISAIAIEHYNNHTKSNVTAEQIKADEGLAFKVSKTMLSKWGDMYFYEHKEHPNVFIYALLWRYSGSLDLTQELDLDYALRVSNIFYVNKYQTQLEGTND